MRLTPEYRFEYDDAVDEADLVGTTDSSGRAGKGLSEGGGLVGSRDLGSQKDGII